MLDAPADRVVYQPTTTAPRWGLSSQGPLVVLVLTAGLVGLCIGAQYVAHRLAYHPNLGAPLYVASERARELLLFAAVGFLGAAAVVAALPKRRGLAVAPFALAGAAWLLRVGPIYGPFQLVRWSVVYKDFPELAGIISEGALVAAVAWLGTAIGGLIAGGSIARRRRASGSHGTARWGTGGELLREEGLLLGRRARGGRLLRYDGDGHLITLAPTRSGKGVSAVIPNLLEYLGSAFVVDVKPENAAVTVRRRLELGNEVHVLDPFAQAGGNAAYNPMDLVDLDSPDAMDDARLIADMLVTTEGEGADNVHWNDSARPFIAGLILFIKAHAKAEKQNLVYLRKLAALPVGTQGATPGPFDHLMARMLDSRAADGLVSRAAATLLQKSEKERSGVLSTVHRHTDFLDSPRLRNVLCSSTFDLADLKRKRMSVFLCLPTDRLPEYHRWIRLMIGSTLRVMMRTRGWPEHKVLMLLDEFQNLGRLGPVERDISLAGGFGVRLWLFVQDISRLQDAYPKAWETFFTNTDVLQAFGASNDKTTSDYLSWLTGETTIFVESENQSRGVSRGRWWNSQRGTGQTVAERGRRLLTPDEVRRMDRNDELLFLKGADPLLARRLNYLTDVEFRGQFDPNPQHQVVAP
jgi:type IV secretion system protein VirD4